MGKIVNFIGSPGTGKSSIAAGVFSYIKFHYPDIQIELILEPHKALCYTKTFEEIENFNELYQQHKINLKSAISVCDLVLTDAPLMFLDFYAGNPINLNPKDINIRLNRVKLYNNLGRWHSELESDRIGLELSSLKGYDLSVDATYKNIFVISEYLVKNVL